MELGSCYWLSCHYVINWAYFTKAVKIRIVSLRQVVVAFVGHWVLDLCNDIKCDYFYVHTRKGISNRLGIHRGNIAIVAIIPILIAFYVPFFKKLRVTSRTNI